MHHVLCHFSSLLTGGMVYCALTLGHPELWAAAVAIGLSTIKNSIATGEY